MPDIKPLYIVSTMRTGTTLLRDLLNQPKILDPYLTDWFSAAPECIWEGSEHPRNCLIYPQHAYNHEFGVTMKPFMKQFGRDLRVVHTWRRNLAELVTSTLLATATDVWNVREKRVMDEYAAKLPSYIGDDQIRTMAKYMRNQQDMSFQMVKECGSFLSFEFWRIIGDPEGCTRDIFRYIGVPHPERIEFDMKMSPKKMRHPARDEILERVRTIMKEEAEK